MLQMPGGIEMLPLVLALLPIGKVWWGWRRHHGRWWYDNADPSEKNAFAHQVKGRIFLWLGVAALVMLWLHFRMAAPIQ